MDRVGIAMPARPRTVGYMSPTAILATAQWFHAVPSPLVRVLIALIGIFVVVPAYFSPKTGLLAEDGDQEEGDHVRSLLLGMVTFGLSVPAVWLARRTHNVIAYRLLHVDRIAANKEHKKAARATEMERARRSAAMGVTCRDS